MKTLYIVRHAKSSWDNVNLPDFDRPLNTRGKTDAPRMGKRLKEKDVHPNLMLSSPAKRALSTSKRIAEVLNYPEKNIKTDKKLYHADAEDILSVIRDQKNRFEVLMVFGHNPGLTDFVNEIGKSTSIDNIPTCGIVAFRFDIDEWHDVTKKSGELLFFDYPKNRAD
jgi:phosphohistidine phosphatase